MNAGVHAMCHTAFSKEMLLEHELAARYVKDMQL
jgi:hypothetical protein